MIFKRIKAEGLAHLSYFIGSENELGQLIQSSAKCLEENSSLIVSVKKPTIKLMDEDLWPNQLYHEVEICRKHYNFFRCIQYLRYMWTLFRRCIPLRNRG